MAKLNIKVSKLKTLLELAQLKGLDSKGNKSVVFEYCVLKINKRKKLINIDSIDVHHTVISLIEMKCTDEIITGGEIPVEFDKIMSTLNVCSSNSKIKFEYKSGKYVINPEDEDVIYRKPGIDEDEINTEFDTESLGLQLNTKKNIWESEHSAIDTYFKVESKELNKLLIDASEVNYYMYSFFLDKESVKVNIYNTEDTSNVDRKITVEGLVTRGDVESAYSVGIGNVIKNLTNKVDCWIATNNPIIMKCTNNDVTSTFIVSPYDAEAETESEEKSEDTSNETQMSEKLKGDLDEEDKESEDKESDEEESDESDEDEDEDEESDEESDEDEEESEEEDEDEEISEL